MMSQKILETKLTYADVLLVPKKTPLNSRSEAIVASKWTRNISINVPFVSSNMATVTEHKMAIAMAREGGLGTIHQFMSIEEQAHEVKLVKRSTSYVIENPVTILPDATIQDAINSLEEKQVTSLLVSRNGQLEGIFTRRDYIFEENHQKLVREAMTPRARLVTARPNVALHEAKRILQENRIEKLPLIDETGTIKGLITTKDIYKLELWKSANRDAKGRLRVAAALGVKDTLERAEALVAAGVDCLVLDVAHAHSDLVISRLRDLKERFPIDVMVGNIATAQAAHDLIKAGADGLKVGIGPSPVCSTRTMAGAGIPQLSAVVDVVSVAKEYAVPVTADGGLKTPGDVSKAIAAGASTIFSGTLFAGTDEAPGRIILKDGKRYKRYMGSASYDSNHERKEKEKGKHIKRKLDVFVEGASILVDYKGPVRQVIKGLVKGLQSGMSYCGARTVPQMQANAEFIRITSAGLNESLVKGKKISE